MRLFASAARRRISRRSAERKRRRRGLPHTIIYFHEVADPYSHLAAQALSPLLERFDVKLEAHLVGAPPEIAMPEPKMAELYAIKDASAIAPFYDLEFSARGQSSPSPELRKMTARLLAGAAARGGDEFAKIAPQAGQALWAGQRPRIERLASSSSGLAEEDALQEALKKGDALRHQLGHYLSAMFFYGGEWYWGIDRLHYLEERLDSLGARKEGAPRTPATPRKRSAPAAMPGAPVMRLEYFPSLRSPYTYLSMDRVLELPKRYPIEIAARPVLPMVMRGMKVPPAKGLYIFSDCEREAERLGIPFGKILDPVGAPVLRGYSLFAWASSKGRGGEYLAEHLRASFAEGLDAHSPRGLRRVVERAGLSWDEALPLIDNEEWHDELERNREDMFKAGCWGVPSFRLTGPEGMEPFAIWGRDRLWLLEEEIAKRAARMS